MGNIEWGLVIGIAIVALIVITLLIMIRPGIWFRSIISGPYFPFFTLIRWRLMRFDVKALVLLYTKARKAGVKITPRQIETFVLAKGNIKNVVEALIAAQSAGIILSTDTAMAVDLAGRDINDAVKHNITPKVIETPKVDALCKNGVELTAKAKITLRTNLKRIIGGALEETIVARVCEGIVTTIGSATNHKALIESPDKISKQLLVNKSISADTAFDIISIDISDIDVGRNIGAELDIDQAEAIKFISQAEAEKRRSEALAAEQEMRALTQEMRARVVAAEAMLPQALADALDRGVLGVQDYYRLNNLIADTEMRKGIAGTGKTDMLPAPKKKTRLG